MEMIYPLISTTVTGPLGVVHLPRLWLKTLLHATGRLPEGYRHGMGGFDEMTLTAIGIEPAAFIDYIEKRLPTYLEFEAWIKANATQLDAETIAKHNETVRTRHMREEMAAERRASLGIPNADLHEAVILNDLDDWTCVHAQVTRERKGVADS